MHFPVLPFSFFCTNGLPATAACAPVCLPGFCLATLPALGFRSAPAVLRILYRRLPAGFAVLPGYRSVLPACRYR